MLIYLALCCYNRPFDPQSSLTVLFETDAKLRIQELIKLREVNLVWSFMLDYENEDNPNEDNRDKIAEWEDLAQIDCDYSEPVVKKTQELMTLGLKSKDAAHVACTIMSGVDYFITTDKGGLNKPITDITVINPIDFIRRYENA
ncbi:hypothetical protein FACS189454_00730 [Planctomycetales bacterium]|nr:hypothetical protein FACS189454_00730 [Planctomycetales bacterium]